MMTIIQQSHAAAAPQAARANPGDPAPEPVVATPALPAPAPIHAVPTIQVTPPGRGFRADYTVLGTQFMVLVLAPIALAFAWRILRRPAGEVKQRELAETNDRLSRIEQAVDSIAIEVERVTEGQRFLTRTLGNEGRPLPDSARSEGRVITPH